MNEQVHIPGIEDTQRVSFRIAKTIWTSELLVELMHLPEGTRILSASSDPDNPRNTVFTIEHPDLPLTENGRVPFVKPSFITTFNDKGEITKIEFVDWGWY